MWWIDTGTGTVVQATQAQAEQEALFGPYATKSQAEAALAQAQGRPTPTVASGQWWNIWTLASAQAEEIVPHTIQSATKPVQGSNYKNLGQIYTVNGPYSSKAAALQAIGQNHGPAPNSTGPGGAPTAGLADIGDFFHRLTEASTWIRVGEVLAGAVILYVGLKAATSGTAVGNAASGAKKGAKKAIGLIPK